MGARLMNAKKKAKRLRHRKSRARQAATATSEDSAAKTPRRRASGKA